MQSFLWLAYGCLTALVVDIVWWVKTTLVQKRDYRSEVFQAMVVATLFMVALGPLGFWAMLATIPVWAGFIWLKTTCSLVRSIFERKSD